MARILNVMRETADGEASEQDLVRRARAGDRAAFEDLVRLHFTRVYAFLHRMIGNHEDAEDLAQESFVRAWRSLEHYRGEAAFGTWLARIALHLAHDRQRKIGRETAAMPIEGLALETVGAAPRAEEADTAEIAGRGELGREVLRALDRLPPKLRAALVLRAIEGRDYSEVSQITGVKLATARTRVMQARKLLSGWLGPWLAKEAP